MLIKLQDEIMDPCSKEHHCSYATNMSNYAVFRRVRKVEKSFVTFVRPSAWSNSAPTVRIFMEFDIWGFSVEKIQVSLKLDKNKGYYTWRSMYIFDHISSFPLRMNRVSDKSCREYKKKQISCSVTTFRKSCRLRDNVEKYCRAGQAADGNMAHAHCMLDT